MRGWLSITASMASSCPTTADARPKLCGPRSKRCRKWSPRSESGSRVRRWRLPPGHRRVQGPGARRQAVGIGRPLLWGLGAFGQAGVDRVHRNPAGRTEVGDGQLRHADRRRHHPRIVATPTWKISGVDVRTPSAVRTGVTAPSDFRCARSAKWSGPLPAPKRVRLYTTRFEALRRAPRAMDSARVP